MNSVDKNITFKFFALHVVKHFLESLQLYLCENWPRVLSQLANEQTWGYGANTKDVE